MRALLRADWLRLGKRRTLQVILLAIPLLAATFFLLGFRSNDYQPYFDEAAERASLTDQFSQGGMPADQIKEQVDQAIQSERQDYERQVAQMNAVRATYAFPASIPTLLGTAAGIYLLAMILLAASTIGDEFSWGTIRTSLLASSDRRRWLLARLLLLGGAAVIGMALLLLLSAILPLLLVTVVGPLPQAPPTDGPALALLVGGILLGAITLIGFAAASALLMRSGGMTLLVAILYALIESTVLGLIAQLPAFRPENAFGDGKPAGALAWLLGLFPVRAFLQFLTAAQQATGGVYDYGSQAYASAGPLGPALWPLASVAAWGVAFIAIAVVRFDRMDIAE